MKTEQNYDFRRELLTVHEKALWNRSRVQHPDEYLARVAHEGRDAILVFTKGANQANDFPLDFNDLIRRAARYGIDVYAYSKMKSKKHPLDESAEEYYEDLYGRLFRECPGLKGVTLVGESIGLPYSKTGDPRLAASLMVDGIPNGKFTAGIWSGNSARSIS